MLRISSRDEFVGIGGNGRPRLVKSLLDVRRNLIDALAGQMVDQRLDIVEDRCSVPLHPSAEVARMIPAHVDPIERDTLDWWELSRWGDYGERPEELGL